MVLHNNDSITACPDIAQGGRASNSINFDTDVSVFPIVREDHTEEAEEDKTGDIFNKYGYDEFGGPGGKRLLDRILQQVLTYANWRTWHFADSFVAPGSDCYVGPYRLAQEIRPGI